MVMVDVDGSSQVGWLRLRVDGCLALSICIYQIQMSSCSGYSHDGNTMNIKMGIHRYYHLWMTEGAGECREGHWSTAVVCVCVVQEAVASSGYICQFKDLQVRSVLLDEIMPKPDQPELDCIVVTEAKVSKPVLLQH